MKSKGAEKRFLIVLVGVFLILLPCSGNTAIPPTINYQGYLTNAAGVPVNGTVTMVFTFYTVDSGGSPIWSETQNVTVNNGVYNVNLGDVTPISSLPFGLPYYLGVKVGADPEMVPRIPLTSVGYAFRAQTVESVGSHIHSGADITSGTVLEPRIDSAIARTSALSAHTSNTNNPHSTTAAQTGAAPSVHSHSGSDITTGTVAEARIDPLIARDSEVTAAVNAHALRTDNPHSTTAAQVGAAPASHNHDDRYFDKAYVNALEARIAALEAKLTSLTRSGNDIIITGANLHIRSGSGSTSGTINGLGNLIVGYNELRGTGDVRTGSHNLIVGKQHNYSSYSGIVAGYGNTISGIYASISGGNSNTASGNSSSVSGGNRNTASGTYSSVSGGTYNTASGNWSSVSGGDHHTASGPYSSVSGGRFNTASGDHSSISGGYYNTASGDSSSVSGGYHHTASGDNSSVSGGYTNTASGQYSSVSGGGGNTASGYNSSVSGGEANTASGSDSSVSGGGGNTASVWRSSVSGGNSNAASGVGSSVSGGMSNTASGYNSSVSGGMSNAASHDNSSVSGGYTNTASGQYSSVSGGFGNQANAPYSSISGGDGNTTAPSATSSSISGGAYHTVTGWADWAAGGLFQTQ